MQHFQQEGTQYDVSNVILYRRHQTNEPPANVYISGNERRMAIEAAHKLIGHQGREGTLRKVVKCYRETEKLADVKEEVKDIRTV
jgi:hypothetical protein